MILRSFIFAALAIGALHAGASVPQELEGVGVEEKLGAALDQNLEFIGENGRPLRLGQLLNQGRPVILNFAYYSCPMLCSMVLNGLTTSIRELSWTPGKEYDIVTLSIDPREMYPLAASKKQAQLVSFDRPAPVGTSWPTTTTTQKSWLNNLASTIAGTNSANNMPTAQRSFSSRPTEKLLAISMA